MKAVKFFIKFILFFSIFNFPNLGIEAAISLKKGIYLSNLKPEPHELFVAPFGVLIKNPPPVKS